MSTEQLAREEGVDEKYIKKSIAMVEAFRAMVTLDDLEASQVEVVLFNKELEKLAIHGALKASTAIYNAEGKKVSEEPNHEIRLDAVKVIKDITESLISSKNKGGGGGGNNVNVNVWIATFEDRLHEVKRKRGLLEQNNPPTSSEDEDSEVENFTPDWDGRIIEQSSA
jgi:aspartate ammonia-lyase